MTELIFLRPWWLAALLPLAALAWRLWRQSPHGGWARVISPQMLVLLQRDGWLRPGEAGRLRLWLPLAGALLIVALSGPAVPRAGQAEYRRLDPLLLLLDLSPSVVASPVALAGLQTAAMRLLQSAEGRPVGVMGWAADAYLISSPTSDAESLEGTIAVLSQQTMPVAGSRPDIALSMARDLFAGPETGEGPGIGGADLVVITDGAGIGERASEEARRLASDGARVWGLALPASAEGAPAPQPEALRSLARAGGGEMFPEAATPELVQAIASAARLRLARDPQSAAALQDFGPWLLALAMIALLPLFRRREG
ncbi:VWA domain-containing protein [Falsigemmobacter intermedius]|uniref:VWA domain-containing protein n=1 Tax=Falsigemmobacter intermedius TaxID=1553448 RepID=A0A3S3YJL3_9RHOB|nr:VWA domain-containing protein [Falsigemmobacter intermedius]RWY41445.1 VWA domain-containing protein [Falsigemmobacter intermedius]